MWREKTSFVWEPSLCLFNCLVILVIGVEILLWGGGGAGAGVVVSAAAERM